MEQLTEDTNTKDNSVVVIPENTDCLNNEKSPTPPPLEQPKKSKKEERAKKDDKSVEQFMKSLNSVPSLEEKLSLVCKKYMETVDSNKKLQFYMKQSEKRYVLVVKEKEQLQHEFNKTILVKSKLENLCRELQKQNKAIKEESLLKIREEEERRKETHAKFQNTLSEITALLQQNNEKNAKLRDDNISMSEKFKSVVQQYQLREQQVDKMSKQMALESQLSDAKLQKASLEHRAEKERMTSELEQMKVTVAQCRAKILELQETETVLRSQLAVYTDKYDEFQNALVKSNQVFGGFKKQMENMAKKMKKLEKECVSWKERWESSQTALIDMCSERQTSEERANQASKQLHCMQNLCRVLQSERSVLLNVLKENNIPRPPLAANVPPTVPPPLPATLGPPPTAAQINAKVDAMAEIKQSLAHLQTQLNVLTNKNASKEEPVKAEKAEKQKKTKSKKSKSEKAVTEFEKADSVKSDDAKSVLNAPKANDNKAEVSTTQGEKLIESLGERVDEKTLESLIQAISNANIRLCDLEVGDLSNDDEKASNVQFENQNTENINVTNQIDDKSVVKDEKVTDITDSKETTPVTVVQENDVSTPANNIDTANEIDTANDITIEPTNNIDAVEDSPEHTPKDVIETANKIKESVVNNEMKSNLVREEVAPEKIKGVVSTDETKDSSDLIKLSNSDIISDKVKTNDNLNESINLENGSNDEIPHLAEVKSIVVNNS